MNSAMNTLNYRGYTARMDFDADDKIIVGRVVDIDDIITFHGQSVTEFELAFHQAIDGYIHACEQLGQTADKPASGRMMLRVNPLVHAAAVKASARSGESLNKWAEKVLGRAALA
jgi:predicted HicB family RNase H-like nuclease